LFGQEEQEEQEEQYCLVVQKLATSSQLANEVAKPTKLPNQRSCQTNEVAKPTKLPTCY
jgi:hypothetical protein